MSDGVNTRMLTQSAATSPELIFLIDGALSARQRGCFELSDAFARAAEAILRSAFPAIADDIAQAASRKGQGNAIGARLAQHLDAVSAACVAMVLMLRGSRKRVVDVLASAFGAHPEFLATTRMLCQRLLDQMPASLSTSKNMISHPSIEVAAPRIR